jgi:hypothetical protein
VPYFIPNILYQSCSVNGLQAKVSRRDFPVAFEWEMKRKERKEEKRKEKIKYHEPAVCVIWFHRIFNVPAP